MVTIRSDMVRIARVLADKLRPFNTSESYTRYKTIVDKVKVDAIDAAYGIEHVGSSGYIQFEVQEVLNKTARAARLCAPQSSDGDHEQ